MHPAVELLIKRMESNPDEFVQGHKRHHKWERLIEKYSEFMEKEDRDTLKRKYCVLQMDQMHKSVMAELLYGDEKPVDPLGDYSDELRAKQAELKLSYEMINDSLRQNPMLLPPGSVTGFSPPPAPPLLQKLKGLFK